MKKIFSLIFCLSLLIPNAFVFAVAGDNTLDPYLLGQTYTSVVTNNLSPKPTQAELNNVGSGLGGGLATNCDKNPGDSQHGPGCNLYSDLKPIFKNVIEIVVTLSVFAVIIMVAVAIIRIMFLREAQRSTELKEAKEKFLYAIFGFIIIVAVGSGLVIAIYQTIGVKNDFIQAIKNILSYSFIDTAYAGTDANLLLPSPTNITNLYDFLLVIFQAVVRWFIFPAIIFAWFYVGAAFVYAKGSPDKLKEARKNLLYVFAGTVIIMMLQGMLIALQETIKNIFA